MSTTRIEPGCGSPKARGGAIGRCLAAIVVIVVVSPLVFLPGGCAKKADSGPAAIGGSQPGGSTTTTLVTARWPFWPTRMRIHPLSLMTIDPETRSRVIEARLELLDDFGHTTKGIGQARFELYDRDPSDSGAARLAEWNIDLRTLEANASHYDQITQTYLFRLRIDEEPPRDAAYLKAYFLSIDGRRFVGTARLRR